MRVVGAAGPGLLKRGLHNVDTEQAVAARGEHVRQDANRAADLQPRSEPARAEGGDRLLVLVLLVGAGLEAPRVRIGLVQALEVIGRTGLGHAFRNVSNGVSKVDKSSVGKRKPVGSSLIRSPYCDRCACIASRLAGRNGLISRRNPAPGGVGTGVSGGNVQPHTG